MEKRRRDKAEREGGKEIKGERERLFWIPWVPGKTSIQTKT